MATPKPPAPHGILSYFTRHGTASNLLLVVLFAIGLAILPKMRAQFFPDVIIERVNVTVHWTGAGADDIDLGVVQALEPALLSVEGVTATSSRSTQGSTRISLEFEPGWDMTRALNDVQDAVDGVSTLPAEADAPVVSRTNWRDPVTDVVISGPVGIDQLARFTDEMISQLYLKGVTRTTIQGIAAPQTVVEVATADLIRNDITLTEIANAIGAEAVADPAGNMASSGARVSTGVAKRRPEEIAAIALRSNPDGSTLRVGDVATIYAEGIDRNIAYFSVGKPALLINVSRSAEGDAIAIQHSVEAVAKEMKRTLPASVSIDLINTRSEVITGQLDVLKQNGVMGLGLVVLLLFLFLNTRTAFWVAAGIPVSMLVAVSIMYLLGLTFNMISIFALIITLGIVVDDAIVVGEHADFRSKHRGEGPITASETAARRMFAPVLSSTLTTIIAFYALVAIGGRFGAIIEDIPITVIAVLSASLMECFLVLPNHMAHALTHSKDHHWYDWPSRQVNKGFRVVRERLFRPLMRFVMWARYPVLAGAVFLLASQVSLLFSGDVRFRFFNAPEQANVTANFAMAPGATRQDTEDMLALLEDTVNAYGREMEQTYGTNPVIYVLGQLGGNAGRGLASAADKEPDQLGSISIELINADDRPYTSFDFVSGLQQEVPHHPMLEELSFRGGRFGPGGDSLSVKLSGANADVLKAAAEALKDTMAQYPEVSALEDSLAYDKTELVLELTPQGKALGFSIDALGAELRNRLGGITAATYPDGMRSATIKVQLPPDELSADFLGKTMLRAASGVYVPLGDIVTVSQKPGFASVNRENGLRLVTVTGDIDESNADRAAEINDTLKNKILPTLAEDYGIQVELSGLAEQQQSFLADAQFGLAMALLGIFLVLAWIFSSWTRPLVVMAIIPFGLVGALWGHHVWNVPMNLFSVVGMIGMVGIIINDSIVLVSTIDEYAEDRSLRHAIVDAVADRLRPVFLTTATTVIGLAPLLFETSSQAQFLKPTVITLTYGLGVGFVLVLLIVPALLAVQEDLSHQLRALKALIKTRHRLARAASRIVLGSTAALIALFGLTLGWVLVDGALPFGLWAGNAQPIVPAAILFVAGAALILGLAWIGAVVGHLIYGRRVQP